MPATTGVVYGMPNSEYHAGPGISNSGITQALRSPMHYHARYISKTAPEVEKAGQLEGTLLHCAVIEPDEFGKRYVVGPDVRANTKEWRQFVEDNSGKTVIKAKQYDDAMRQALAVRLHPFLAALDWSLIAGEVSAFAMDDETGLLCKCRPDIVCEMGDGVFLLDLKTYSDASPEEFNKQIGRKGYYRQSVWYQHFYGKAAKRVVNGFAFVAVEDAPPYGVGVYTIGPQYAARGEAECRTGLDRIAASMADGMWPGYSDAAVQLDSRY